MPPTKRKAAPPTRKAMPRGWLPTVGAQVLAQIDDEASRIYVIESIDNSTST